MKADYAKDGDFSLHMARVCLHGSKAMRLQAKKNGHPQDFSWWLMNVVQKRRLEYIAHKKLKEAQISLF